MFAFFCATPLVGAPDVLFPNLGRSPGTVRRPFFPTSSPWFIEAPRAGPSSLQLRVRPKERHLPPLSRLGPSCSCRPPRGPLALSFPLLRPSTSAVRRGYPSVATLFGKLPPKVTPMLKRAQKIRLPRGPKPCCWTRLPHMRVTLCLSGWIVEEGVAGRSSRQQWFLPTPHAFPPPET